MKKQNSQKSEYKKIYLSLDINPTEQGYLESLLQWEKRCNSPEMKKIQRLSGKHYFISSQL